MRNRLVAAALLASAPHLRILATSREPLGVAGEALWPVEPLALAEQAARASHGTERERWLRRLDTEVHNLRGAVERALHVHDTDTADRLVQALTEYWSLRGRTIEARSTRTVSATS